MRCLAADDDAAAAAGDVAGHRQSRHAIAFDDCESSLNVSNNTSSINQKVNPYWFLNRSCQNVLIKLFFVRQKLNARGTAHAHDTFIFKF